MKKVLVALLALAFAVTANADVKTFKQLAFGGANVGVGNEPMPSYADTVLGVGTVTGEGSDWQFSIWDTGTDTLVQDVTLSYNFGWYDGYGYGAGESFFDAAEGSSVALRLWNDSNSSVATYYLDTQAFVLPTLSATPGPTDADVAFDFTGSTWVAVPEPATIGLFGLGALSAWILRRSKKQA